MNKILVLNMDSSPVTVMSFERGFRLAYKGKADVVSHVEDDPINCAIKDEDYLTLIGECPTLLRENGKGFKRPTIVRLNKYVFIPFKKVTLSRFNIYRRDEYTCVYCPSKKDLTIDHVKPRSKGGKNSWENLVTCCSSCNTAKGNKPLKTYLEESGQTMRHEPYRPTYMEFLSQYKNIHEDWKPYVYV
jgi:5-methylcytosine-specific restriction endonuclease McrA